MMLELTGRSSAQPCYVEPLCRVFSDGIFAAAFHQDPRYYRVVNGSIVHRGLLSARQAFVRRSNDGVNQFNYHEETPPGVSGGRFFSSGTK